MRCVYGNVRTVCCCCGCCCCCVFVFYHIVIDCTHSGSWFHQPFVCVLCTSLSLSFVSFVSLFYFERTHARHEASVNANIHMHTLTHAWAANKIFIEFLSKHTHSQFSLATDLPCSFDSHTHAHAHRQASKHTHTHVAIDTCDSINTDTRIACLIFMSISRSWCSLRVHVLRSRSVRVYVLCMRACVYFVWMVLSFIVSVLSHIHSTAKRAHSLTFVWLPCFFFVVCE